MNFLRFDEWADLGVRHALLWNAKWRLHDAEKALEHLKQESPAIAALIAGMNASINAVARLMKEIEAEKDGRALS